jgi:hypothetical protein
MRRPWSTLGRSITKKKKFFVEVGQKTVRERGINGVRGGGLLELAKDRLRFLYF